MNKKRRYSNNRAINSNKVTNNNNIKFLNSILLKFITFSLNSNDAK